MTYYEITRAQQYIQDLGFSRGNHNPIDDRSQVAVADAFRADNSFYSPFTRTDQVRLGRGGRRRGRRRDPARVRPCDAGQPVAAASRPAGACERGARRGLGRLLGGRDVLPVAGDRQRGRRLHLRLGRRPPTGQSSPPWRRSPAGSAAAAPTTWTLAEAQDPQQRCRFDIHCVGQVWSSALWDLRNAIGGRRRWTRSISPPSSCHRPTSSSTQAADGAAGRGRGAQRRRQPGRDLHRDGGRPRAVRWRLLRSGARWPPVAVPGKD